MFLECLHILLQLLRIRQYKEKENDRERVRARVEESECRDELKLKRCWIEWIRKACSVTGMKKSVLQAQNHLRQDRPQSQIHRTNNKTSLTILFLIIQQYVWTLFRNKTQRAAIYSHSSEAPQYRMYSKGNVLEYKSKSPHRLEDLFPQVQNGVQGPREEMHLSLLAGNCC